MPDDCVEVSYEDAEMDGAGHAKWTSKDWYSVPIGIGIAGGVVGMVYGAIKVQPYIQQCCAPANYKENVEQAEMEQQAYGRKLRQKGYGRLDPIHQK